MNLNVQGYPFEHSFKLHVPIVIPECLEPDPGDGAIVGFILPHNGRQIDTIRGEFREECRERIHVGAPHCICPMACMLNNQQQYSTPVMSSNNFSTTHPPTRIPPPTLFFFFCSSCWSIWSSKSFLYCFIPCCCCLYNLYTHCNCCWCIISSPQHSTAHQNRTQRDLNEAICSCKLFSTQKLCSRELYFII